MADHDTWVRELERTRPSRETLATMFMGYEQRIEELQTKLAEVGAERDQWRRNAEHCIGHRVITAEKLRKAETRIANALLILERNLPWERQYLAPVLRGEMVPGEVRGEGDRPAADHVGIFDGPPLRGEGDQPAEHRESDARPGRCASPDHKPVWADQWPCEHSGEGDRG